MSIPHKLFLAFGFLILFAVLQGGFSVMNSQNLGALTVRTFDQSYMSINFARSAQTRFFNAQRLLSAALLANPAEGKAKVIEI